MLQLWRERFDEVALELESIPPGKPLGGNPFPSYQLRWGPTSR
jgi:hypothetical protein